MELIGKWLFPHQPARVQRRKVQMLLAGTVLALLTCAVVAALLILANYHRKG